MNKNIEYYNENANAFYTGTVNADMSQWRNKFESYIVSDGYILDAGCGSGRDSLAFIKHGYSVFAFDASHEMCRLASKLLNQEVVQMSFDEITFEDKFDGIWACASLLHEPIKELPATIASFYNALKKKGIMYASFKYGEGTTKRGERTFSDFTENSVQKLMKTAGFEILECGITQDVRLGRIDEKWVNVIAKKDNRDDTA